MRLCRYVEIFLPSPALSSQPCLKMDGQVKRKFSCKKCSQKFSFKTSLQLHMKSHPASGGRRDRCHRIKQAKQKQPLTMKKQQVPCVFEGCECVYSSAKKMQSHFMRRHPNREADIADLLVLLEEGQPLPALKTYDGDTSSDSSSNEEGDHRADDQANEQRKSTEKSVRNRECSYCGRKFQYRSQLEEHIRVHTGEKPFLCDRCPSKFTAKSSLKMHIMRRHTNEKPISCSLCSSRFVTSFELQQHLIAHSGEKRFSCEQCSKKFTQRAGLLRHMRVHTGEKPFPCDQCSKKFSQASNLAHHLKIHRRDQACPRDARIAQQ